MASTAVHIVSNTSEICLVTCVYYYRGPVIVKHSPGETIPLIRRNNDILRLQLEGDLQSTL
jgi:hypothetical protein